jgi:hypothetical protein
MPVILQDECLMPWQFCKHCPGPGLKLLCGATPIRSRRFPKSKRTSEPASSEHVELAPSPLRRALDAGCIASRDFLKLDQPCDELASERSWLHPSAPVGAEPQRVALGASPGPTPPSSAQRRLAIRVAATPAWRSDNALIERAPLRDGALLISAVRKRARNDVDEANNTSNARRHEACAKACIEGFEVAFQTLTVCPTRRDLRKGHPENTLRRRRSCAV